ncbi:2307_t:CDS:2 [Funneliformis caledonium]|uniref:2307_t:CDS:1 n=1 Tax=Funneliformis caledonium TaxID=1117310 RepID=A0A9N9AKC3_9GLOM|nr:2307_t:CDS:2 [Funneliformis caledonium]
MGERFKVIDVILNTMLSYWHFKPISKFNSWTEFRIELKTKQNGLIDTYILMFEKYPVDPEQELYDDGSGHYVDSIAKNISFGWHEGILSIMNHDTRELIEDPIHKLSKILFDFNGIDDEISADTSIQLYEDSSFFV